MLSRCCAGRRIERICHIWASKSYCIYIHTICVKRSLLPRIRYRAVTVIHVCAMKLMLCFFRPMLQGSWWVHYENEQAPFLFTRLHASGDIAHTLQRQLPNAAYQKMSRPSCVMQDDHIPHQEVIPDLDLPLRDLIGTVRRKVQRESTRYEYPKLARNNTTKRPPSMVDRCL